jgi:plasmid stabilization system protein ParE
MRLIYDREARTELAEAYRFYEASRAGLGSAFLGEIERAVTKVLEWPLRWRKISGRFRRALITRFPYGIIYSVEENEISVVAFMHLHRKPGYWKSRGR